MGNCFFEAVSSEIRNLKTSLRESGNIEDNDFVLPEIGVDATVGIQIHGPFARLQPMQG